MAWLSPPGFTFFAIPAQWWLGGSFFDFGVPYVRRELGDAESGGSAVVLDAVCGLSHRHGSLEFARLGGFQRCSGQPVLRAGAVGMEDGPVPAQQKKERQVVIEKLPSV